MSFVYDDDCSLQNYGWTALMHASNKGHTDIALALSQHPDINVNLVNVSISLLSLSIGVVGGKDEDGLSPLIIHPNPLYHNQH